MLRFLPFLLIPILIIAGLGYWRFTANKQSTVTLIEDSQGQDQGPVEVPKTLPGATLEDRVKSLEETLTKLIPQVNNLKPGSSPVAGSAGSSSSDSRLTEVETAVTELKARVSSLEQATPAPVTSGSKYPLYIPMGSGGGPWGDQDWNALNEYQVSINPDNYSGYSGMQLEANFRLAEAAGTGSVRLYNITDSSSISSEVNTTSTSFGTQTSSTFKLPSGAKTYTIQIKSNQGKSLFVQSARIKVNF